MPHDNLFVTCFMNTHTLDWVDGFINDFLDFSTLCVLFPFFCKLNTDVAFANNIDVISHTLILCISTPLRFVLNSYGMSLFYNNNLLVFPYTSMTRKHKALLQEVLDDVKKWKVQNSHVVLKTSNEKKKIDSTLLLKTMCYNVFNSCKIQSRVHRETICNIILQRVQGYVPISIHIQKELNQWCMEYHNLKEDTKKEAVKI